MKITKGKLLGVFGGVAVAVGLSYSSSDGFSTPGQNLTEGSDGAEPLNVNDDLIAASVAMFKSPAVETNIVNRAAYATTIRNPYDIDARENVVSSVVHEDRVPVSLEDPRFDPIGRLVLKSGDQVFAHCSATLAVALEYEVLNNMPTVYSSGHCFKNKKTEVYYQDSYNMYFAMDYIDINGVEQTFETLIRERPHLMYELDGLHDLAVVQLSNDVPEGMPRAIISVDHDFINGDEINCVGFSADKQGLYQHTDAIINQVWSNKVRSNCDLSQGASGAPVIVSLAATLIVAGVNSSIVKGDKWVFHDPVTSEFLDGAPFLQRVTSRERSRQCLEVTASMLNVRDGRSSEFNVIAKAERGAQFVELDRIGNWSKVKLPDTNRSAYIHNGHARSYSC
jgi:hypothetical protein